MKFALKIVCLAMFACSSDPARTDPTLDASGSSGPSAAPDAADHLPADNGRDQAPDAGVMVARTASGFSDAVADSGSLDAGLLIATELQFFPDGSFMYQPVESEPVDPRSNATTQWLTDNAGFGAALRLGFRAEVFVADSDTTRLPLQPSTETYWSPDCDTAPFPLPRLASEGDFATQCASDAGCLLLVVDPTGKRLYEMLAAHLHGDQLHGGCAAIWDLSRVYGPEGRGEACTSADAVGLPIAPLLLNADEVAAGSVEHALRFLLPPHLARAGFYRHPGNHAGLPSGPDDAPIYGSRFRLREGFNLGALPNDAARAVARALQRYGMIVSEGGSATLTAQTDRFTRAKWNGLLDEQDLSLLKPADFELVQTGDPVAITYACMRTAITQ